MQLSSVQRLCEVSGVVKSGDGGAAQLSHVPRLRGPAHCLITLPRRYCSLSDRTCAFWRRCHRVAGHPISVAPTWERLCRSDHAIRGCPALPLPAMPCPALPCPPALPPCPAPPLPFPPELSPSNPPAVLPRLSTVEGGRVLSTLCAVVLVVLRVLERSSALLSPPFAHTSGVRRCALRAVATARREKWFKRRTVMDCHCHGGEWVSAEALCVGLCVSPFARTFLHHRPVCVYASTALDIHGMEPHTMSGEREQERLDSLERRAWEDGREGWREEGQGSLRLG